MGNRNNSVLITGGSRGIGKEIVKVYKEAGYNVIYPTHQELDLSSRESVESFLETNKKSDIGIIINNAGINHINYIDDMDMSQIGEMTQVNLLSPLMLVSGFTEHMRNAGFGRIVNIGSIWGVISKPGRTGYSMTKHGIHGMTKTLAVELAPYNILVNTVAPGQTMTELTVKNNPPEAIEQMKQDIPLGRLADPAEIAKVVFWLGSDENTYVTGQQIVVDGGLTIK